MSGETIPGRTDYMEAMVDLAYERGYETITIEEIAGRVGGDRAGFEAIFPSKQACAIAALEALAESNLTAVRGAFRSRPEWPASLRAAAYAHVRWILANPKKMRFGLLETRWAGEVANATRERLFGAYVTMIDAGREVAPDPESIPPYTAESVVGSITQVVAKDVSGRGDRDLLSLVPEMMYLAVRPYLGEEAAKAELTEPPPGT